MRAFVGWSLSLTSWCLVPVALTVWPVCHFSEIRLLYVALWAAWGWLPVSLAFTSIRSAASLRLAARRTVDTRIPQWCQILADRSSLTLLRYLDNQTITLAHRRQQAEDLIRLWKPRVEQAQKVLQDPDIQALVQQLIPPAWRSHLQSILDSPLPQEELDAARQSVELWLQNLEVAYHNARTQSTQPLADWLALQTQTFVQTWYQANIAPRVRHVLIGYRIWLSILVLWALTPWFGWLSIATVL